MTHPLPSGWTLKRLGDITERITRKNTINNNNVLTISAEHGFIKQDKFFSKIVASKDLSKYILLYKGDFCYNKSYCRGYPYGVFRKLKNYDVGVATSLYIYFKITDGDSNFFEYLFDLGILNKQLSIISQEGVRNHGLLNVPMEDFFNMTIPFPPLEEQKRIAEVLSLCDDVIENLTELIDKKEQYKKGVMQRLLSGEVRFKGFKDEWTFKSLEKLCNIKKGEQKNKLDLVENGKYPVLSGGMDFSGYYNSYNREANTITISEGGNSCGYVNFIKTKFWASGHCYTLHDVNIDSLFLYQCLKYNENKIMKLRLGSGLPNIQLSYIREYTLKIPTSIEEQKKIGEFLSTIDNEIDNLKKQLELRKQQKKGLMQRLLTGEVRI
ncbi:restriction endonuclease subunit S [Brachyspira intermedia]|uniref:restriction endonuclease subunit S n=1 Tax=Brachyspira intermedia TaxID=84377 RepID=UPI0030058285